MSYMILLVAGILCNQLNIKINCINLKENYFY